MQYAHLQDELHVYCVYEGDKSQMGACFSRAVKLIRLVLTGGTVVPSGQVAHHAYGAAAMPAYAAGAAGATHMTRHRFSEVLSIDSLLLL